MFLKLNLKNLPTLLLRKFYYTQCISFHLRPASRQSQRIKLSIKISLPYQKTPFQKFILPHL